MNALCKKVREIKELPVSILLTDMAYQRICKDPKVAAIVRNFNPHKVDLPDVSCRDGKYYAFDGQHTIAAIRAIYGPDAVIDCVVHYGLTYEQEAMLFAEQQDGSTKVSKGARANAYCEGKDAKTLRLKQIVESVGLKFNYLSHKPANGQIMAIDETETMHEALGDVHLASCLTLIRKTWGGHSDSLRKEILRGMCEFYQVYHDKINENTFIRHLGAVNPLHIKRTAESDLNGSLAIRVARAILNAYNRNLQQKNRLPYELKG